MKKLKNKTLLGFILGAIIFGGLGIVVAEYKLKAIDVEFKNGKSVQTAIEDLYDKANVLSSMTQTINIIDINNNNHPKRMFLSLENNTLVGTVYFDPTNIDKNCDFITVGNTTDKNGCMKWYVYDKLDTSYGLLLDHNIYWGDYSSTIEEKDKLTSTEEGGSNWKVTPSLISGADIARITKKQGWDKNNSSGSYYFDTLTNTSDPNKGLGTSKYYWLFDYTQSCTEYGCRIYDETSETDNTHVGFWTSDCEVSCVSGVWEIDRNGRIASFDMGSVNRGLRPVITISKSNS